MPSFDFPPPDSLINTIPEAGGVLSCIHRPEQDISMSNTWKSSLKDRLLELPCHFTWNLFDEDLDVESVEEKLHDQLGYLSIACKHRLYSFMAYLKHLQGDNDEAILQLQKAEAHLQKYGPSDADLKKLAIYSNYAWVYLHDNQYSKSLAYAEKAKTIIKEYESPPMKNSLLLEIYSERGWVYVSYPGKYFIKAVEYFEKAMELDPNNPELNSGFAIAVYREEQFNPPQDLIDKSFPLLERAIELNPNDVVLLAIIALKHHQLKNYDKAEMLINQVLQKDPESPYILRYIAMYYNRRGFMNEAIAVVKKALNLTPTSSSLHFLLGNFYLKWSNQKKKEMGRARDQSWYYYKPQIAETISNAIFHFEKAVELKKTFVIAYFDLANMYCEIKDYKRAEETFQKHYKECFQITEPSLSCDISEKALKRMAERKIRSYSPEAAGFALLGFVYKNIGQREDAIEYYEQALEYDRDNEEYLSELCELKLQI
ncbi:interferon-induced protein with tetratricopeptide repeats 5-like [Gastrophryne carolinensis]